MSELDDEDKKYELLERWLKTEILQLISAVHDLQSRVMSYEAAREKVRSLKARCDALEAKLELLNATQEKY